MKRVLFFILFLSLLVSFGNQGWVKWYKLRQFERNLENEIRFLSESNLTLQKEIADLKDPQYLEGYIREELGYVRDNELLYEIVETNPGNRPETP